MCYSSNIKSARYLSCTFRPPRQKLDIIKRQKERAIVKVITEIFSFGKRNVRREAFGLVFGGIVVAMAPIPIPTAVVVVLLVVVLLVADALEFGLPRVRPPMAARLVLAAADNRRGGDFVLENTHTVVLVDGTDVNGNISYTVKQSTTYRV